MLRRASLNNAISLWLSQRYGVGSDKLIISARMLEQNQVPSAHAHLDSLVRFSRRPAVLQWNYLAVTLIARQHVIHARVRDHHTALSVLETLRSTVGLTSVMGVGASCK